MDVPSTAFPIVDACISALLLIFEPHQVKTSLWSMHTQRRPRSDCLCAQSGKGICYLLTESLLQSVSMGKKGLGPVVQSVVSVTSSLWVISLTVLADSIYNILIFFCWKNVSYSHFFSKKFQHICVSLDVNFNESLTNDVVSFEQLGPGWVFTHVQDGLNLNILKILFHLMWPI